MRKTLMTFLMTVGMVLVAGAAFAAEATSEVIAMTSLATAIGMAIAAAGCGIGQGMGLKGVCEGTACNPEVSGKITVTMLIGLAMIESLGIYALVVNLILFFANPFISVNNLSSSDSGPPAFSSSRN